MLRNYLRFMIAMLLFVVGVSAVAAAPQTFSEAKTVARTKIYADRNQSELGTLYCGCQWRWVGQSGGRVDLGSCGYQVRKNQERANRIEWEHIVPAWTIGHQRQCWQQGGRKNCTANDPVFNVMEADLHNLSPVIGEVNGDRSNFNFGMVSTSMPNQYGQCTTRTDFKARTTEPRDQAKGRVARVSFYMFDRYGLRMSRQQQRLLMAWHKQFPVDAWELERDRRIAAEMGHNNPFVTGEKTWTLDYRPSGEGLKTLKEKGVQSDSQRTKEVVGQASVLPKGEQDRETHSQDRSLPPGANPIIGNKRSRVYHLPQGCPSYDQVATHNQQFFTDEVQAKAAGFRKAGNCRR
ncbi:endonuclease [Orrella sp. 11846]|uniref:endonuclease n=1 Tax=Orrella sp. 11846 TaxID=3409913 RepID=UPI003B5C6C5E